MSKKKPFQVEGSHPAAPERMSGEVFRFRVSAGLDLSSEARRARESEAHMKAERDAAIADTHEVVDRYEDLLAKVKAERDAALVRTEKAERELELKTQQHVQALEDAAEGRAVARSQLPQKGRAQ